MIEKIARLLARARDDWAILRARAAIRVAYLWRGEISWEEWHRAERAAAEALRNRKDGDIQGGQN